MRMRDGQERAPAETDEVLVRTALAGSAGAFEALVGRYFGMVFSIALARLGEREPAEEAAQEVFVRVHLRLAEVREPRYFSTWLTRVARNVSEDWARRGQRASRLLPVIPVEEMAAEPADPRLPGTREALEKKEELEALGAALDRLPRGHREVVLMHFVDEVSKAEIARRLGVHQSTIGRQLEAALMSLRYNLGAIRFHDARIARAVRPSSQGRRRAALVAAALAGMSGQAKAALVSASAAGGGGSFPGGAASVHGLFKQLLSIITSGGMAVGTGKQVAALMTVAGLLGGGYYYKSVAAENESGPVGIRPGQPGGLNAFTVKVSTGGKLDLVKGQSAPPDVYRHIGLHGDGRMELGDQMMSRGGAEAPPLEEQLFGGKRKGELFIQPVTLNGRKGSVIFFGFPSEAEAEAGLQMARSSDEGKWTEMRRRGNFVAVVIGGGTTAEDQLAYRKEVAEALDRQGAGGA